VILRTADIGAVDRALAANAVQRGRVEDMGGARMLTFHDPDGNEIIAMEPPAS
jgi:hypothetical protein